MTDTINLDDHRPIWTSGQVMCSCGHEWTAVYAAGGAALECPKCGEMTGKPDLKHFLEFPCGARFPMSGPGTIAESIAGGSRKRTINGETSIDVTVWRGSEVQRPKLPNGDHASCLSGCPKLGRHRAVVKLWPEVDDNTRPFRDQLRMMVTCCPREVTHD